MSVARSHPVSQQLQVSNMTSTRIQANIMEETRERMVPEFADSVTFWEHVYRYRFARQFVAGRTVVDVACGEGYGAFALSKAGATNVIGIDISEEACSHARRKYGLDTRCGSALDIPLPDNYVEVVVSFETIEHVQDSQRFVEECRRILMPDGLLVISTPNKEIYSERGHHNPFHCRELSKLEFMEILDSQFGQIKLHTQRPQSAAWWSPRSLASDRTWAWMRHFPGFYRLQSILYPNETYTKPLDDRTRNNVVDLILNKEGRWNGLMNPYAVRADSPKTAERPLFFIAVAQP
jgi:ubiquinone/menaquinone biosynthesis C-methylase UbiE